MQTGNYADGSVTLPKIDPAAIDAEPTQGSSNLVTSGGVWNSNNAFNYAQNSDFTQWVAEAGIGDNHGNQAYGGDRWILDSGTITGDAREDGNGYENITLNGTIRQIVANPPAIGTVGIDMVSGTATASYANGEITITSSGGVIKDVWLYEGTYEAGAAPKFQPKGYAVELQVCGRCFTTLQVLCGTSANAAQRVLLTLPIRMRAIPTVEYRLMSGTTPNFVTMQGAATIDVKAAPSSYAHLLIKLCADYE